MNSRILIILGMHRSGTSLIAQWLYKSGLHLGDNLLPPQEENKDGYYEDIDFLELHEKIFRKYGIPYGGFVNLDKLILDPNDLQNLKDLIQKKKQKYSQWGWKEPRTCLFAEYYRQLLPEAKFLIIIRDFNAVISSLLRRHFNNKDLKTSSIKKLIKFLLSKDYRKKTRKIKSTAAKYAKATIFYYQKILELLNKLQKDDFLVLQFEKLTQTQTLLRKKLEQWGFDLKLIPIQSIYKPNYVHHRSNYRNKFIPRKLARQLDNLQNKLYQYAQKQK